jgi:hypothetical protein
MRLMAGYVAPNGNSHVVLDLDQGMPGTFQNDGTDSNKLGIAN